MFLHHSLLPPWALEEDTETATTGLLGEDFLDLAFLPDHGDPDTSHLCLPLPPLSQEVSSPSPNPLLEDTSWLPFWEDPDVTSRLLSQDSSSLPLLLDPTSLLPLLESDNHLDTSQPLPASPTSIDSNQQVGEREDLSLYLVAASSASSLSSSPSCASPASPPSPPPSQVGLEHDYCLTSPLSLTIHLSPAVQPNTRRSRSVLNKAEDKLQPSQQLRVQQSQFSSQNKVESCRLTRTFKKPDKQNHNLRERSRREHLKKELEELVSKIPSLKARRDRKVPKKDILDVAANFCQDLVAQLKIAQNIQKQETQKQQELKKILASPRQL